jgi:hypothetical protein
MGFAQSLVLEKYIDESVPHQFQIGHFEYHFLVTHLQPLIKEVVNSGGGVINCQKRLDHDI